MGRSKIMLASAILESDEYAELSIDARLLYVLLHCKADYLGVLTGPRAVMRMNGLASDALEELIDSRFVIEVEGYYLIRHWWASNNQDKVNARSGNTWIYEHVRISSKKTYEGRDYFDALGEYAWDDAEIFIPGNARCS